MDDLQRRVAEWGEKQFPAATFRSVLIHLKKEVLELEQSQPFGEAEEAADIVMLLFHIAHRRGFSLREAIERKFSECQRREWLPPDADGVVEHRR